MCAARAVALCSPLLSSDRSQCTRPKMPSALSPLAVDMHVCFSISLCQLTYKRATQQCKYRVIQCVTSLETRKTPTSRKNVTGQRPLFFLLPYHLPRDCPYTLNHPVFMTLRPRLAERDHASEKHHLLIYRSERARARTQSPAFDELVSPANFAGTFVGQSSVEISSAQASSAFLLCTFA